MGQPSKVVAVVVTYNPSPGELSALLSALRPQVSGAVVVDNGSANLEEVSTAASAHDCHLIALSRNEGIAFAQNQGILWALSDSATPAGADFVLLSDQDSVPADDMVHQLLLTFDNATEGLAQAEPGFPRPDPAALSQFPATALNGPVAAVGPVPVDDRGDGSGGDLVYSFTKWGAKRTIVPGPDQQMAVPFVLASGCLISRDALEAVGPMDQSLFIDHVDLAWCLRAIEKGYRILVSGNAKIYHSLGDDVAHVPGRKRAVHLHSPIRNYYMMRNTLLLQSASFLPRRWKVRYLWWMVKYMGYYTLAPGRTARVPMMLRAIRDGLAGRSGALGR